MKAIITGGNKGIGFEISKELIAKGFEVHVLSRSEPIEKINNLTWHRVDVRQYSAVLEIVEQIGTPQVFINNAGIMNTKTASDYSDDDIQNILNVNLISGVKLSIYFANKMANNGGGRIISLGSIAGEIGHPDIWYGISKAGVMNAMRSIARSHGARGVIANAIAPGPVETDMMNSIPEERKARLKSNTINQRFCTAIEVARVAGWLASEAPAYINGEIFDMNNGSNFR